MSAPNAEKGARYLAQLDTSLCAGAWADIPEHARKVDKHAPDRRCLTLAARCEAQVASASHRPTSAASSASSSIHSLGDLVPKLQEAINGEGQHADDVYAARVCLAEIHWLRGDADEALRALQRSQATGSDGASAALGWQEVCEAKANFITGAILESKDQQDDARRFYLEVTSRSVGSRTAELRRWTERLLARACVCIWRSTDQHSVSSLGDALRCFQAWSEFWQRSPTTSASTVTYLDTPRRVVWKAYYHLLSAILQAGLVYAASPPAKGALLGLPDDSLTDEQLRSRKRRQRSALKQVETTYESLLLNETQFPKASQANTEVEDWVENVIRNWKVFSSSQWTADELGEGGQEAVSRNVLDILYRASTKTFHSTAILRQLFSVHASLGDFELAIHAFNSYVEIVSRCKTRAEKTGKHELGFDSDDTAICTAAQAIHLLCRYGDREEGEKANEVVRTLRKWLGQKRPGSSRTVDTTGDMPQLTETSLQPKTLAAAYRAIGTCRLHWARLTFDDDQRARLGDDGVKHLRQAHAQDPADIETAFALASALAQSNDLAAAIGVAKGGLAATEANDDSEHDDISEYQRERSSMPLWHILALCSSANDEYEQAAKMCEAAFGQFGDSTVLFGEHGMRTSVDSERSKRSARGSVDQMDAFERASIVQLKMTQLSLIEYMEGADVVVKSSEDLLTLYTRLFGRNSRPEAVARPTSAATATPPSRSGGTLRSIAGSIRPRSRSARRSAEREAQFRPPTSIAEEMQSTTNSTNGHDGQADAPVAITVTNEDGVSAEKHHRHLPFKLRGHQYDAGSLRSTKSNERLGEKATSPATPEKGDAPGRENGRAGLTTQQTTIKSAVSQSEAHSHQGAPEQPLGKIPHNASSSNAWPPPPGHDDQPPRQDVRLPVPHPASQTSSPPMQISGLHERQHKVTLLVEVWLFIAGMYLRADLFDDCGGAVQAAFGLVERFEEEVATECGASARRFYEKGWGLGKSVDELWGDVWAAKATLSLALDTPFEAISSYERSLSYWPDHAEGIIGLSNLLMDMYEEKMPIEEPEPSLLDPEFMAASGMTSRSTLNTPTSPPPRSMAAAKHSQAEPPPPYPTFKKDPTPAQLNRLAARDRAYMLLSTLTKLGDGSENPEAWLALARSHELSGQLDKAKQALWWVVRLEEGRGVRDWGCVR